MFVEWTYTARVAQAGAPVLEFARDRVARRRAAPGGVRVVLRDPCEWGA